MQQSNGNEMATTVNIYGSNVFNDSVMRQTLPKETYKSFRQMVEDGFPLDPQVAEVMASVMKDWAIAKGATHFTHWFQPMTGITAEKHDSFISPTADGRVMMEFSGKELSRANRIPLVSIRRFALPSKPVDIPPGTTLHQLSSRTRACIFLPLSLLIPVKRWIKRRRYCARWMP